MGRFVDQALALSRTTLVRDLRAVVGEFAMKLVTPGECHAPASARKVSG
jgi:hypothetical protein